MPKIIDYRLVTGEGSAKLTEKVKTLLAEGWQPLAGITSRDKYYAQALVIYEQPAAK